jgi:hypothetical protein
MVISNKKSRRGEAFILHGDTFVLKVYRVNDAAAFAHFLVDTLNEIEDQRLKTSVNDIFNNFEELQR